MAQAPASNIQCLEACQSLLPPYVYQSLTNILRVLVINQQLDFQSEVKKKIPLSVLALVAGVITTFIALYKFRCQKEQPVLLMAFVLTLVGLESVVQNCRILLSRTDAQLLWIMDELSDNSFILLCVFIGYRTVVSFVPTCSQPNLDTVQTILVFILLIGPPIFELLKNMLDVCSSRKYNVNNFISFVMVLIFPIIYFVLLDKTKGEIKNSHSTDIRYWTLIMTLLFGTFIVLQRVNNVVEKGMRFLSDPSLPENPVLTGLSADQLQIDFAHMLVPADQLFNKVDIMEREYAKLTTGFRNRSVPTRKIVSYMTELLRDERGADVDVSDAENAAIEAVCENWWESFMPDASTVDIMQTSEYSLGRLSRYLVCANIMVREQNAHNNAFLWKMFYWSLRRFPPDVRARIPLDSAFMRRPDRNRWFEDHPLCRSWSQPEADQRSNQEWLLRNVICIDPDEPPTLLQRLVERYVRAPVNSIWHFNAGLAQILILKALPPYSEVLGKPSLLRVRDKMLNEDLIEEIKDWGRESPDRDSITKDMCSIVSVFMFTFLLVFIPCVPAIAILYREVTRPPASKPLARLERSALPWTWAVILWVMVCNISMRWLSDSLDRVQRLKLLYLFFSTNE